MSKLSSLESMDIYDCFFKERLANDISIFDNYGVHLDNGFLDQCAKRRANVLFTPANMTGA